MGRLAGPGRQGEPARARVRALRLLFAGTPDAAIPALRAVLASGHEVVAVLTRPDAPAGRGRTVAASPVAALALESGIEVLRPSRAGDPAFIDRLAELAPDCCPVVAYGGLIPPAALAVPPQGWVNLHFSLLPAWRGAAPVQHAIIAGDDVTGSSTFRLDAGLDTGPVLGLLTEAIRGRDTGGELLTRLADAGAALLVATLDAIAEGRIVPQPQPAEGVSFAPKLGPDDARVRWGDPAVAVDRRIRGCTPAPGAWTTFRGARLKLGPVLPSVGSGRLGPGELCVGPDDVLVGTATGPVALGAVQPPGKRPMPAADWARGARPVAGEAVGTP